MHVFEYEQYTEYVLYIHMQGYLLWMKVQAVKRNVYLKFQVVKRNVYLKVQKVEGNLCLLSIWQYDESITCRESNSHI